MGVVPAAGRGTRLGLARGSKELVEVGGVPVIEHLLTRLEAAGCDAVRVVTRPDKEDLVAFARGRGLEVVLGDPPHVGASIALGCAGLAPGAIAAVGFPDTVWEPGDGFRRLLDALAADGDGLDGVLGLFRTPDAHRSDVVLLDPDGRVERILVKPARPPSDLIYGCFVARVGALAGVGEVEEPGRFFDALGSRLRGVVLSDRWIDVGTPEGLARARAELG